MMPQSPEQPPMYQQPYAPPPYSPPPPAAHGGIMGSKMVGMIVLAGLVLFFVGLMILSSTAFVKPPKDTSSSDYEGYRDTMRNMGGAGRVVIELGGLLASIGLFGGGILGENIKDGVRVGMVSAGVAFIVSTLVVLGLFSSLSTMI